MGDETKMREKIYAHPPKYYEEKRIKEIGKVEKRWGKEAYKKYVTFCKKIARENGYEFCGVQK